MGKFLANSKNKISKVFKKLRTFFITYAKTNIIFISYVLVCLINSTLLRYFTTDSILNIKPFLADLALLILIGSLGYLIKPKNRFKYYSSWAICFTAICIINCVYYHNYVSFVSFSLLSTSKQAVSVADAITKIFELKDLLFLIPLIVLFIINYSLKKKKYFIV